MKQKFSLWDGLLAAGNIGVVVAHLVPMPRATAIPLTDAALAAVFVSLYQNPRKRPVKLLLMGLYACLLVLDIFLWIFR